MFYTIVIILSAIILGLIDIKDQIRDTDSRLSVCIIKLICMIAIIISIVMIEK